MDFKTLLSLKALVLGLAVCATSAPVWAAGNALKVRIITASAKGDSKHPDVDSRLDDLKKELVKLNFGSYQLRDTADFNLELKANGRMQLPSGEWLTITPLDIGKDGKLRVEFEAKELKFKSTVFLAQGNTLAVGGPLYDKGALILALSRPKAP